MSRVKEEQHLEECIKVIKNNINKYTQQDAIMSADIKEMYDHFMMVIPKFIQHYRIQLRCMKVLRLLYTKTERL